MAKPILKFLGIFILTYTILIIPATGFGNIYAEFFRAQAQMFFGNFAKNGVANFKENEGDDQWVYRTNVHIYNAKHFQQARQTGSYQAVKLDFSWYFDYLFVALLIALILATPVSWKRKAIALVAGFILIHVYINFSIYIELMYSFQKYDFLQVINMNDFGKKAVLFFYPIVRVNYGTGIFAALVVWLITCFRREDLKRLTVAINQKTAAVTS